MASFRVCVAGRNHSAFTEECVTSILCQEGADFVIDWTDDASTEKVSAMFLAAGAVAKMGGHGHHLERRPDRRGGLANLWHAIRRAHDDDVCVLVGGDDWLEPGALERVAREYEDPECWLTYGQMKNTLGPEHFRAYPWNGKDPREQTFLWAPLTVRAKLVKKICEDDLKMAGWFFLSGGDVALNIPLVEMAGPERSRFIAEPWYNRRIHAGNDHNVDRRFQDFCGWRALCKPRYARLPSLEDAPIRTPHLLRSSIIFTPQHAMGHAVDY
jgi:hypothetical protein